MTTQAFRNALHIPQADPTATQVVATSLGGDLYTTTWSDLTGGGGGGIPEAPADGQQYGRNGLTESWTVVVANPTWATLSGKPSTFPPTVPINWSDITGQPSTYPPDVHTHSYSSLTGIPSTFAPSAHSHPQSEVTNLVTDLAAKEPALPAGGTTGNFLRGDKTWQVPPTGSGGIGEAPTDGQVYTRRGSDATWQVAAGGSGLTDGDKGDIVVSASGATWMFDSAVVTAAAKTVLDDASVAAMLATMGGLPAASYTAADVLAKLLTVDGAGSLLDADFLDGNSSAAFALASHSHAQGDITGLGTALGLKAPLLDPVFTGNPTAPTPTAGDNDTSIATTAFVSNAITNIVVDCGTY